MYNAYIHTYIHVIYREVARQNTSACPRDLLLVLGNEVIEATMSWRSRFFEYRPYRGILNDYYKRDPKMLWTCAPKPLMRDELYRADYPQDYGPANKALVKDHVYLTSEAEPVFDAADIMRFGKDVFVHMGFTTNNRSHTYSGLMLLLTNQPLISILLNRL